MPRRGAASRMADCISQVLCQEGYSYAVYYEQGKVIQAVVEGGGSDDQGDDDDCAIDLPGDAPLFTVADPQHFGV